MEKVGDKQELPKLPKGDGTLRYAHGGKILYRKSIPVDNGYKRLSVTGCTLKECFDAMRRKESEIRAELKTVGNETLCTAMLAVFMAVNMLTSALALARYDARTSGDAPNGQLEVFLDEHFDNARMEHIYPNAKKVTKAE